MCRPESPGRPCPRSGTPEAGRGSGACPRVPAAGLRSSESLALGKELAGVEGAQHPVRRCVALADEPVVGGRVAPPFADHVLAVLLEVDVGCPFGVAAG